MSPLALRLALVQALSGNIDLSLCIPISAHDLLHLAEKTSDGARCHYFPSAGIPGNMVSYLYIVKQGPGVAIA